jgi:polyhydroxyalkanoate synthesis repressor PhaR
VEAKTEGTPRTGGEGGKRLIKRYSNRKLYDTKDSRYVTLLQIADLLRGGEEVQIIDNNSKEDLTEVTLAQIIFEEKKANSRTVPLQTLKELIHQRTEKVLSELREGPIGRLIPGQKGEKDKVEGAPAPAPVVEPPPPPPPPPPTKPTLVEQAKLRWEDLQHDVDERIRSILPSILPWQQLEAEVKRLHARIEELEARVGTSEAKSSEKRSGKTKE